MIVLSAVVAACGGSKPTSPATPSPAPPAAQTWADEFDGPANSAPDPAKWTYDLGGGGWGNQELETYTNQPQNVSMDGAGHLVIRVERSGSTFTSARLKTQGLFAARYGKVEARIRLPFGQGIWPAFWMLGTNITSAGWPATRPSRRKPATVRFSVDGVVYKTVTPASLPAGAPSVLDNSFFLLLNVAVGGTFPGGPDASTQFPQQMMVDYVRVSAQ